MKIGVMDILWIVFIILKLTDVINWSWIWVLSPLWISLLIGIGMGIEKYRKNKDE
jgi:hypothetical protein